MTRAGSPLHSGPAGDSTLGAGQVGSDAGSAIRHLDAMPRDAVAELLEPCSASPALRERLLDSRPWRAAEGLSNALRLACDGLGPEDWLRAFSGHPRIGDMDSLRQRFGHRGGSWSEGEQAAIEGADDDVLRRLRQGNLDYEARFGHVFLICATGRGAGEILAALEARLGNEPATELANAAAEERQIVALRLDKLLAELATGDEESQVAGRGPSPVPDGAVPDGAVPNGAGSSSESTDPRALG